VDDGPTGTASVAVEVGLTTTAGVFVTASGVTPGISVAVGAPGEVVSCATADPVANVETSPMVVGCAEANKLLCGMGVFVTAGACE
jgi:hypothetical protein